MESRTPSDPRGPQDWCARAEALPTSARDLSVLSEQLLADGSVMRALREAVAARRDRAFTNLLFAGGHRGLPLGGADLLTFGASLLPDLDALAAAAGHLEGDVGSALVAAVGNRTLGWAWEPAALLIAQLWARRAGLPTPEGLLAAARVRARSEGTPASEDALLALHGLLEDPDFGALVEGFASPDGIDAARALTRRFVEAMKAPWLQALPDREVRAWTGGTVRRAVAKVGRNEACPCGSGKKYKACHEGVDRDRLAASSDVAGLTTGEVRAALEQHLDLQKLDTLRGAILARLDPAKVAPELVDELVARLGQWGEIDAAQRASALAADPAAAATIVAEHALDAGRIDVVRDLLALLPEPPLFDLVVAAAPPDARLALLEHVARRDLDNTGPDLAYALFANGYHALGVHVARSLVVLRPPDEDSQSLYALLLEARDELLASPWDPIDHVLYTLDHGVSPEVQRELTAARKHMDQGEQSLRATEAALETLKDELARKEALIGVAQAQKDVPAAATVPVAAADDRALRELRERVERLKGDLKERHSERNALRRALDEARQQVATLETAQDEEDVDADTDDDDEVEGEAFDAVAAQRIRVPVLPDDFEGRLKEVPEATARAALVRIGELCAGYEIAFREVRPLRGLEGTWRAKIGRSYRLLFRPNAGTLEVVDLVHRQDLEKRLFRIRRS